MAGRDAIPDLLEDWRRYERVLLTKLANRDRELLMLHEDYLELEQRCNVLMGVIRRQAQRDTIERVNRAAKAVNDG